MKYLLLTLSILLLSSCIQQKEYLYKANGIWCQGISFSMSYIWFEKHTPYLSWNVLEIYRNTKEWYIYPLSIDMDMCDFSYTREEIKQ